MNYDVYNVCQIVTAAKKALLEGGEIADFFDEGEAKIRFDLLSIELTDDDKHKTVNLNDWYKECLLRGLEDIKFLTPIKGINIALLGFAGQVQLSILCFYKDGKVTYFTPSWVRPKWTEEAFLDRKAGRVPKEVASVVYKENLWENAPREKPKFDNQTADFIKVLEEITEFANEIDQPYFAKRFSEVKEILMDTNLKPTNSLESNLPITNLRLYLASAKADVFGAMGSWNDSPPYYASQKNLMPKYDDLSSKLHRQMTQALLYSINEWDN